MSLLLKSEKSAVFWTSSFVDWRLSIAACRAFWALSNGITWISSIDLVVEIQAKYIFLFLIVGENKRTNIKKIKERDWAIDRNANQQVPRVKETLNRLIFLSQKTHRQTNHPRHQSQAPIFHISFNYSNLSIRTGIKWLISSFIFCLTE